MKATIPNPALNFDKETVLGDFLLDWAREVSDSSYGFWSSKTKFPRAVS